MIKKLRKLFSVRDIDLLVFKLSPDEFTPFETTGYELQHTYVDKKTKYFITDNGRTIHSSTVFPALHVLKLLNKRGPAIGDCFTDPAYRGKSIYPFVINKIAGDIFASGKKEVFMIVNSDNAGSIKGMGKAGFKRLAHIRCKRVLMVYFNINITKY